MQKQYIMCNVYKTIVRKFKGSTKQPINKSSFCYTHALLNSKALKCYDSIEVILSYIVYPELIRTHSKLSKFYGRKIRIFCA